MNISFTKKQENYINKQVETGDYQNNSEVIRDALRLHEIYREKVINDLRNEIRSRFVLQLLLAALNFF